MMMVIIIMVLILMNLGLLEMVVVGLLLRLIGRQLLMLDTVLII